MRHAIHFFAALLLSGVLPAISVADEHLHFPEMGDSAGAVYTPEYERILGHAFLRQARMAYSVIIDPELEHYLNSLGKRIVASSDNPTREFFFFSIFNNGINAFAGPGGVIGINSGVILQSRNESELAGVLAHEVAHITQRHLARTIEQAKRHQLPLAAAKIGAILLGAAAGRGDAAFATLATISGMDVQGRLNFTRANEEEADRIGIKFLANAGFDPAGLPQFLKKLQRASAYRGDSLPEFLRTHPLTASRIADAEARVAQYPTNQIKNSRAYELMKAKVDVFSQEDKRDALKKYEWNIKKLEEQGLTSEALLYGYATALIINGRFKEAQPQVQKLLDNYPNTLHHLLLAGSMAIATQNYPHATEVFSYANEQYPNNRAVIFGWTKAMLNAGKPQKARQMLRAYRQRHPNHRNDVQFYQLLAQAEGQYGERVEAIKARAEHHYLLGQTERSIEELTSIEEAIPKLSAYQQATITARRTEWEREIALEKELNIRN
ncbi:MAG: beta-barrel assembly-enhancing protease [Candidatus Eutrophobiaceae bacterium]